jgi:hypothetical protein
MAQSKVISTWLRRPALAAAGTPDCLIWVDWRSHSQSSGAHALPLRLRSRSQAWSTLSRVGSVRRLQASTVLPSWAATVRYEPILVL